MFVVVVAKETVDQKNKYSLIGNGLIAIMVVPLAHSANSKQLHPGAYVRALGGGGGVGVTL